MDNTVPTSDTCGHLTELNALKEKVAALEARLDRESLKAETRNKGSTKVIFSAEVGARGQIGPYSDDRTLVYQRVFTNIGNAYNQYSGIFTPPVAGVYYFTIFHHAGGDHGSQLSLCRNGSCEIMTQNHPGVYETAHNGANAVFLQLQPGEQIYVRLSANTTVYGSNNHTTFSGFLVDQM